jgi:hypothetical protein
LIDAELYRLVRRCLQHRPSTSHQWQDNVTELWALRAEIAARVEQLKLRWSVAGWADARQAWNQLPQRIAALI